jgi:hypothetical protein
VSSPGFFVFRESILSYVETVLYIRGFRVPVPLSFFAIHPSVIFVVAGWLCLRWVVWRLCLVQSRVSTKGGPGNTRVRQKHTNETTTHFRNRFHCCVAISYRSSCNPNQVLRRNDGSSNIKWIRFDQAMPLCVTKILWGPTHQAHMVDIKLVVLHRIRLHTGNVRGRGPRQSYHIEK